MQPITKLILMIMTEYIYPTTEEMIDQISQAGINPEGLCFNALTTLFYWLKLAQTVGEDNTDFLNDIAYSDRNGHLTSGPESFQTPHSLSPYQPRTGIK